MTHLLDKLRYHVSGAVERGETEAIVAWPEQPVNVALPFTGFYQSWHSDTLEDALERLASDEDGELCGELLDQLHEEVNWKEAQVAYAALYAEILADETDSAWQFDELVQPREYNFRTDEIFVTISAGELNRIWRETDKSALRELVHDRLEQRSGFIPFYSNHLDEWGEPPLFTSAQWSLVLEAYCDAHIDDEQRDIYMVDDCNGEITDIIYAALSKKARGQLINQ